MSYAIVSRCLGVLLLAAAGMKLHGLAVDPAGSSGLLASPEWQVAIVEMEIFLALWLLSGIRPIGSWITALTTFGTFACASFYEGWIGYASCGCFGKVEVNPWLTFGLDVVVLIVLGVGRPDLGDVWKAPRASLSAALLPLGAGILGTVILLGGFAAVGRAIFGSTQAALAFLRGENLSATPHLLDMGTGQAGEVREATLTLQNWGPRPVRLYGGTSDCSCVVTEDLPLTIPAGQERTIRVKMRMPHAEGVFNRTASIMTDDELTGTLSFRVTGRITGSGQGAQTAQ